jgi:hypothetical protein
MRSKIGVQIDKSQVYKLQIDEIFNKERAIAEAIALNLIKRRELLPSRSAGSKLG